jgi:prepilin-type N-terminal cleavage/methylation domain-containing protein
MIKNLKMKRSAFTLVELLVVIAIIGLLSTIVLVSFGPIRDNAADAAIKANLNQMRLAAEIQYNSVSPNTYVGTASRADYLAAVAAITAANGGTAPVANFAAGAYCVQSALKSSGSWCMDSTGYIGATASCDGTGYNCAA